MIRRLAIVAVAISLLLCAGSAALWIRSYAADDSISYCRDLGGRRQGDFNAGADSAWFIVGWGRLLRSRRAPTKLGWRWRRSEPERVSEEGIDASFGSLPAQIRLPGLRVRWTRRVVSPGDTIWRFVIVVRLWTVFLLSAIVPGVWLVRRVAARRRTHLTNRCTQCGYDLRASPERCPECGTPVRAPTMRM